MLRVPHSMKKLQVDNFLKKISIENLICKILFSFSVPLDPVQIEVLKEKEKEEREKWSF